MLELILIDIIDSNKYNRPIQDSHAVAHNHNHIAEFKDLAIYFTNKLGSKGVCNFPVILLPLNT